MNIDSKFFSYLANHHPQLWEIFKGGPLGLVAARAAAFSDLNPQPIPPHPAFQLGATLATEFLQAAWTADRLGLETKRLMDDLDDWCPTPPRLPRFPWHWTGPIPEPEPDPRWLAAFHTGFATRLAVAPIGAQDHRARETVETALKRSLDNLGSISKG